MDFDYNKTLYCWAKRAQDATRAFYDSSPDQTIIWGIFSLCCLVFYLFIVVFFDAFYQRQENISVQMILTKRTHKHKKYITEKNNDPIIEQKGEKTNEPKKTSKARQVQFHSILTSVKFTELLRCEKSARKLTNSKHTFLVRDRQ